MLVNSLIETDRIGDLGLVVVDEVGYNEVVRLQCGG